ncbi:prohibitin family protein [Leptospira bandrabouensis]|uniref:Prohibitin family protein n=1 Tax=Leptospira bandrabouensis TaxID=2484903 RepID=A0A6H3NQL2_9LEPT|nr:prohibitin family protein [Leptospira bandrabouensis]MCG6144074.1 prohibitin family protein [Leptospira bandrabouensis]MCG6150885.1 prohibitin family protein [Leptospira bandrabouensis]MCG6159735.1 prohibitin family protein [Leptospira bandrabouensis]MCG6163668.1 prohibitin family protein [Leptospira bandrabouensis]MCW7457586.1 prohibitin family protein [Leptospira bandrabouensis]
MKRRSIFPNSFQFLVILGVSLSSFISCLSIISPGEVGLMWRPYSTGLSQKPLESRVQTYMPWNSVYIYSIQWTSHQEKVEVLTRDDLTITVSAAIIIRPIQNEIYELEMEIGRDYYEKVVKPQFRTAIRNILSAYNMVSISKETPNVSAQIKKSLAEKLKDKHVEIDDVIIDDVEYSPSILKAIESKLTKQQEQEQMKFEINIAKRDAEIQQISADGRAKAVLIEAEAQAKAQRMISESLTPKYIQLKAMENPNNKLIFVPNGKDGLPIIVNPEGK